ncbi:hypothetical protein ATO8_06581 [Roseivivax marinus]|uniref:DUF1127 domain-containing protein n=1 Tax=Roseivivax marinus TaxID=1379903 RepID=W4HNT8_9RHOB|nr:hypothetical protein [Roseivivax marinus]ETW13675.1 hypothetical protein ATO8_06581 [Roseivivax marinus]
MAHSAQPAHFTKSASVTDSIAHGLTRALTFLSHNNPRYQQLDRVQSMTDAEISARGTTRAAMVRLVFSDRFYL